MTLEEFHQRIKALSEDWHNSVGSHSADLLYELDEILAEFDKSQQA